MKVYILEISIGQHDDHSTRILDIFEHAQDAETEKRRLETNLKAIIDFGDPIPDFNDDFSDELYDEYLEYRNALEINGYNITEFELK